MKATQERVGQHVGTQVSWHLWMGGGWRWSPDAYQGALSSLGAPAGDTPQPPPAWGPITPPVTPTLAAAPWGPSDGRSLGTRDALAPLPSPCSPPASSTGCGSQGGDSCGSHGGGRGDLTHCSRSLSRKAVRKYSSRSKAISPGASSSPRGRHSGAGTWGSRDGGSTTQDCCQGQPEAPAAPWDFPGWALSIAGEGGVLGTGTMLRLLRDSLQVGPTRSPLTTLHPPTSAPAPP